MLSSGMSNSESCSATFTISSAYNDKVVGPHQSPVTLPSHPNHLECPLIPPPPTISCTPPSFPEEVPSELNHRIDLVPHRYHLRSHSRSWAPDVMTLV